jgi:uncharacterized membrane protein
MSGEAHEALLGQLETAAIDAAIKEAERATTGEIRVAVLPPFRGTIEAMTERTAHRLGMTRTSDRNGVLILVDPARRTFRVWGDRSIHEKVGDGFWKSIAAAMQERFRAGDFTGGLVHGVAAAGKALAEHYPCGAEGHRDQLPDSIDLGG